MDYEWVRVYACMYVCLVSCRLVRQDCLASIALHHNTVCARAMNVYTDYQHWKTNLFIDLQQRGDPLSYAPHHLSVYSCR